MVASALPLLCLLAAAEPAPAPAAPAATATAAPPATPSLALPGRVETFGGVLVPALLPPGATSLYAFVGAPDIGVGYRQGFTGFELEGRARANYLLVSATAEVAGRVMLYTRGKFDVALRLALGGGYDTGTFYVDGRNFKGPFVHVNPGALASYRVHDTLRVFGQFEVPTDIGVQPVGGYRVTPLLGGGVEYYLSEDYSVMGSGEAGVDLLRAQLGITAPTVGYSFKVGLGVRLF